MDGFVRNAVMIIKDIEIIVGIVIMTESAQQGAEADVAFRLGVFVGMFFGGG